MRRLEKSKLVLAIFFIVLSLCVMNFLCKKLVFSVGRSVPYHLFIKVDGEPSLYDFVLVKSSESDKIAKGNLLTKRVMCTEGMYLKVSGLDYYCCNSEEADWNNCIYIGRAKLRSRKGEKVTPFKPCTNLSENAICVISVPKDSYFLATSHPDSYDSRYIGFINKKDVLSKLSPIW